MSVPLKSCARATVHTLVMEQRVRVLHKAINVVVTPSTELGAEEIRREGREFYRVEVCTSSGIVPM